MRPYPPNTAPMPAPTVAPPATPDEKRIVDALDLAAALLERLDLEQEAFDLYRRTDGATAKPPRASAIAATRGEAARAVEAAALPHPWQDGCALGQAAILRGSAPIPSATLRTWAANWRALAGSP